MLCIKGEIRKLACSTLIYSHKMVFFNHKLTNQKINQKPLKSNKTAVWGFQCVSCFCLQFNPERKSLEVTTDPSVTGTVELLAMITDPKVSWKWMSINILGQYRLREQKIGWTLISNRCLNSAYFQDAGHPEKLYKLGQAVRAQVVEVNTKPQRFVLSLTGRSSDRFLFTA